MAEAGSPSSQKVSWQNVRERKIYQRSPGRERAKICVCGNVFMDDSNYCRKCGVKRPDGANVYNNWGQREGSEVCGESVCEHAGE